MSSERIGLDSLNRNIPQVGNQVRKDYHPLTWVFPNHEHRCQNGTIPYCNYLVLHTCILGLDTYVLPRLSRSLFQLPRSQHTWSLAK